MDDQTATVIAAGFAAAGGVLVAKLSRPDSAPATAPGPHDLTTIAGLAALLTETRTETSRQITELQARQLEHEQHARLQDRIIGAFRRRSGVLEDAMRAAGVPIPPPDPADAALISGSV